jgi:hypothetical protein
VSQIDVYAGPNGLGVTRIAADEALGLALMETRFSRRRRGGRQNWGSNDIHNACYHEPASQLAKLHQALNALVLKAYS